MTNLNTPVTELFGIGDKIAKILQKVGITTVKNLLENYPRTYRQYRAVSASGGEIGDWVVIRGAVSKVNSRHTAHTTTQLATLTDKNGKVIILRWFNMPFLVRSITQNCQYNVLGQVTEFANRRQLVSPQLHKLSNLELDKPETDLYLPIYRAINTLKPGIIRHKMADIIANLPTLTETLPSSILQKHNLISRDAAIRNIHFPNNMESLELAIRRLSWEELFELQLDNLILSELHKKNRKTTPLNYDHQLLNTFLKNLPFTPTNAQLKAIKQITNDITKSTAMRRLLQGEVGSGKTLVAAAAALSVYAAGKKTLILAPTTILAEQLCNNITELLKGHTTCELYTSQHKQTLTSDILVGTHALLRIKDKLKNIGLVIVDEQHRFGVEDREALTKISPTPHLLMMTATPIPRSLAMTVFHYLDITRLDELPQGRLPVKTYLVGADKRKDAYHWIQTAIKKHNQVFIVTPLIEISEEKEETPLKSVKELSNTLTNYFPNVTIDILHGKMKEQEKIAKLQAFRNGAVQILVATSMIEVGIDIPNANIMIIENAERFGLAQLHQLRGRVGRGGEQGYCLLFSESKSDKTRARLSYFVAETNGEKLAEYDMTNRGPGELYGTQQSGFFNLKVGNLWDKQMLEETYAAAKLYMTKKTRT